MEIDPLSLAPADRYKLLIGGVVPRPIAFVSTIAPSGGKANLAPFSFFTAVGSNPMTLLFCPANKPDGSEKDTLINCKPVSEGGQGEFVVNVASEEYAAKVALAGEPLPYGQSEFDLTGLTTAPSVKVRPPRVAQSPIAFECRTLRVIRTNPGAVAGGNIVLGEVVHVFVHQSAINDRLHIDPEIVRAFGRMGGSTYCKTRDRFDMPVGLAAGPRTT
ncbi:MAG: flavin reductase family protein [Planctomycetota bacterium]|nr:flavin reductase family protein [Planctomycetota bacterium]